MTNSPSSAAASPAAASAFQTACAFSFTETRRKTTARTSALPPSTSTSLWNNRDDHDNDAEFVFGPELSAMDRSLRRRNDASSSPATSRRSFFSLVTMAAAATAPLPFSNLNNSNSNSPKQLTSSYSYTANAAETIGKDEGCNSSSCLGVWDGLLADCPHDKTSKLLKGRAGCVSSQDDTPGIFAEPWDYSENIPLSSNQEDAYKKQMDKLILALKTDSKQRGDEVQILYQEGRYLKAVFTDGSSGEKSIGEFYFTLNDTTVQFRIGSVGGTASLGRSLSNTERSERIRKSLRYLKIPVLRNRKRTFFFGESDDLDSFGPSSNALGPPEEMSPGELVIDGVTMRYGARTSRGSDEVDPKMRIDWVESFPFDGGSGGR